MKIAIVSSEAFPFCKTGGLGDVVGAVSNCLSKENGIEVVLFIPKYRDIGKTAFSPKKIFGNFIVPVSDRFEEVNLYHLEWGKVKVYLIDNPHYFDRPGLYKSDSGDYPDNDERFIFFQRGVLESCKFLGFKPDIIWCHDWQTGLIPAYLKTIYSIDAFFVKTKTVFTIHNIAYQGFFGRDSFIKAGFSWFDFTPDKLEYYGGINFMKAGINYADIITTVSPSYAREICEDSILGKGLEGVLNNRKDRLYGILNGIDTDIWNPATDNFIYREYDSKNFWRFKPFCKKSFQKEFGLKQDKSFILAGCVSRLDNQKGIDIIIDVCEAFLDKYQFAILGTGDKDISDKLEYLSKKYLGSFIFINSFNEEIAHKIYASSDIFLMPSRFEPCGLSQMIASRYGTIAVVSHVGGLKDTIFYYPDNLASSNGFVIGEPTPYNLKSILGHIISIYNERELWNTLIKNAMNRDFSWNKSIEQYIKLFKKII
ncbi:MAG: glycogen synthase, partial [Elusimicrobiales bacterium]|nr:glycogen synthase [Elusimicrobiales bacterium]